MKNLQIFCMSLYDHNLENLLSLGYTPVGLGPNKFRPEWVRDHIPDWGNFLVKPAAKLLGFFIGPRMGEFMWDEPLAKFSRRIGAMKQSGASISIDSFFYNSNIFYPFHLWHTKVLAHTLS